MSGKRKVFLAGIWVTVMFGLAQFIRLGSNLILTRILAPEIFGIMSIVSVVIFGVAMLTDLGLWQFIVRHKDPENKHLLNVIWTIQVFRSWIMFLLVGLFSAAIHFGHLFFPEYFNGVYANPLLPLLIFVSSFGILVDGHKSMASAVMSRRMNLGKIESINLIAQLISAAIMLVWVWFYPTIWALATATIVSSTVVVVLSYQLFPFRHKLAWDKTIAIDVFHFSKWILISSTLTYMFSQGDRIYFGGNITPTLLGVYSIAFMMAATITSVIETLASKIVFPALSTIANNNRGELKDRYYKVRLHLDFIVFLVVGGLLATSPLIIGILYDDRYVEAAWMLQILLFFVIGNTLTTVSVECLAALSITKVRMWVMSVRAIGLIISLPLAFTNWGLVGALWAISINVFLPLPIVYWTLFKNNVFSFINEVRCLPMLGVGYGLGLGIVYLYNSILIN